MKTLTEVKAQLIQSEFDLSQARHVLFICKYDDIYYQAHCERVATIESVVNTLKWIIGTNKH